jgi:transposase-like protein
MKRERSAVLEALRNAAVDESKSANFFEEQRWGKCPACPRCGDVSVYPMMGRDGQRNKDYRWRCRGCKEMFTVCTGTIFEETRLPLRVWVYALWKACSSKKGISALQLSREMEITHKSALFVLRRIRHGVGDTEQPRMKGTVEVDEFYVGGKPRYKGTSMPGKGSNRTPVVGIVRVAGTIASSAPTVWGNQVPLGRDRLVTFIPEQIHEQLSTATQLPPVQVCAGDGSEGEMDNLQPR